MSLEARKGYRRISFKFQPYNLEQQENTLEKSEDGYKRRYLKGISSGIMVDGHGERMTMDCIKNMQEQAKSGDVCLYAGLHGFNFIKDVGILVDSEITKSGEWVTLYRLYDDKDQIGENTLEEANKLWKRLNGLPPYKNRKKLGFSIEGFVPDEEIKSMTPQGQREINKVELEGVVVVSKPAVKESIATAVYKALGELVPEYADQFSSQIKMKLSERIQDEENKRSFYEKKYQIEEALRDTIDDVMRSGSDRLDQKLDIIFTEYKDLIIPLLLQHADIFIENEALTQGGEVISRSFERASIFKQLADLTRMLSDKYSKRLEFNK